MVTRSGQARWRAGAGGLLLASLALEASLGTAAEGAARPTATIASSASVPGRLGSTSTSSSTTTTTSLPSSTGWPPSPSQDLIAPMIPSSVSVAAATAFLDEALSLRIGELTVVQEQAQTAKALSTTARQSLLAELTTAINGLDGLQAQVDATTGSSLATLRQDGADMVLSYRALSVVVPAAREILQAQNEIAAAGKLVSLESALQAAIAAEQGASGVVRLRLLDVDYSRRLAKVVAADTTLTTNLLALQPSTPVADANLLASAKIALANRAGDLSVARSDLRALLARLAQPSLSRTAAAKVTRVAS
ncbi:MAG: hypothetical protein JWM85_729 [Acidimicrobiaceae bacterium]|nr:hypothetical protein [Acidimicrobiaceae bacterium]